MYNSHYQNSVGIMEIFTELHYVGFFCLKLLSWKDLETMYKKKKALMELELFYGEWWYWKDRKGGKKCRIKTGLIKQSFWTVLSYTVMQSSNLSLIILN